MIHKPQPTREKKMVESFGGSLNLIIWIIATLGAGYYSYRCLFGTKGMIDQYGAGDGAAFPLVLIGTFAGAGFIMGIVILISGPQHAWAFVTYSFVQSVLGIIFGLRILRSEWAEVDGVKMSNEFWISPLVFTALYGFLLFNMQEILYVTDAAS